MASIEVTGVGARRVGIVTGLVFCVLAFVPQLLAIILAIPAVVVASSIAVLIATLFTVGMREVVRSIASNPRNGQIAGVSLWTGVACEFDLIFPAFVVEFAGGMFRNGLTTSGLVALLLTGLTARRMQRLRGTLDMAELRRIREFIQAFSGRHGLTAVLGRLEAASE